MNTGPKGPGGGGRPEGRDKDVNRETGTGRRERLARLAVASGKRGGRSVMANMPAEKVVRNESCLWNKGNTLKQTRERDKEKQRGGGGSRGVEYIVVEA